MTYEEILKKLSEEFGYEIGQAEMIYRTDFGDNPPICEECHASGNKCQLIEIAPRDGNGQECYRRICIDRATCRQRKSVHEQQQKLKAMEAKWDLIKTFQEANLLG